MNKNDDVRVAEIAARAEKATPGPWFREYNSVITPGPDEASTSAEWDEAYVAHCGKPRDQRNVRRIADADFISAARDDIPFLLAEVRRLRSVVEDALVALDESPKGVYRPPLARNMAVASILIKSRAGADQ